MIPRCYSGEWIVENKKIEGFHLFYLLIAGVRAFTHDGLEAVDRDPLLRKEFTLEYFEEQEAWRENLARGTESTGKVITGR